MNSVVYCMMAELGVWNMWNIQDAMEYAECEAVVKEYPPFVEAMKKRGIEDMDLVMVDPW